ncbi:MAG TPA: ABC transporter ATP-binding protein [Bacilli bacterium]|nr:ABC transporter ATP-binding protein [Bacilli bacterium]
MKKLIEMQGITKDFLQNDEVIHALKETNFYAEEGDLIAIIGPSGSGKSTFLTILGGLQSPTTGKVIVDGEKFSQLSMKQRSKVRFDKIGFILQSSNLIPFLRISDQMYLYNKIKRTRPNTERFSMLADKLDIKKLIKKYPNELSGGERQRVAIAKALYHDPSVILADEPTASLDTNRAFEVVKLLARETKVQNKATIMVTHDERLTEFCDKVYQIVDGVMTRKK